MVTIITELSKYAMILSLAIYTVLGFRLVRRNEAGKKGGTVAAECAHVRYAVSGKSDAASEYRK